MPKTSAALAALVPVLALAAVLALQPAPPAGAQQDELSRSWNQPVEPFRIAGNLYYVGASDVTAFLLTSPEGHVLLDGGFVETAPLIRRSRPITSAPSPL